MDMIRRMTDFTNIFEKHLDNKNEYYKKNLYFKFQGKTINLGYLCYCSTSKGIGRGYLTHYDLIENEEDFILRKVGRFNYLVFDEGVYKKCKAKIPDEFGVYICNYTQHKSLNGQTLRIGSLEKIRSAMKVEGQLCGLKNIDLYNVNKIFEKELPAVMARALVGEEDLEKYDVNVDVKSFDGSFLQSIKKDFVVGKNLECHSICEELMEHQKAGALIAKKYNKFGFFYDTGTGKTLMALEIIAQKQRDFNAKFMIICPKTIINTAWIEDCDEFFPTMKILPLFKGVKVDYYFDLYAKWKSKGLIKDSSIGTLFEKHEIKTLDQAKKILSKCADHYIINPEAFRDSPQVYMDLYSIDDKGQKSLVDGIIMDESSLIRNTSSKLFKTMEAQCMDMKYVYFLSGKPAPNNVEEYLSQMRILSPKVYLHCVRKIPNRNDYWFEDPKRINVRNDIILEHMNKVSFTVSKKECLDLPETVSIVRNVIMPQRAVNIYNNIRASAWEIVKKALEEDDNPKQYLFSYLKGSSMKLRQVASGIINTSEIKEKPTYECVHDMKIKELLNILHELGSDQAIIWCQFKFDIMRIEETLQNKGYSVVTAYSETKDKDQSIRDFKAGKVQFLIANPKTLQYGVTLTNCSYAIYYSLSYSFEEYYQSHDRIYRKGQTKSCTYIFLNSKDTIDEIMYDVVMRKRSTAEANELIMKHLSAVSKMGK